MPMVFSQANVDGPTKNYRTKLMKNLIILLSIATAALALNTIFAQGSVQLKEMSMKACEAQSSQVPEAQRESMFHICKCTVENTDYESLISKSAAGGESAQDDAIAVAQKCAEENS
jgi:hypothetical protein